jgi:hypothetical protein
VLRHDTESTNAVWRVGGTGWTVQPPLALATLELHKITVPATAVSADSRRTSLLRRIVASHGRIPSSAIAGKGRDG